MAPIRVLVVDDSVVVRRVLTDLLSQTPGFEVAGSAATASIGIQKIIQVNPDVVVMDVEMPEMDGVEAAAKIHAQWPKLPILMCSSVTERGAETTLRALAAGASDYIAKPSALGRGPSQGAIDAFGVELLAKVAALAGQRPATSALRPVPQPPLRKGPPTAPQPPTAVTALAIGCSTGGPNALGEVFAKLPGDLPVPILVVQHMPPLFTRLLAERLTASTSVSTKEAEHGELIEPGRAYIAPGNFHMTVVREGPRFRIALNQEVQENSCRPAVDVLFRSMAAVYGPGVLAAVLTGMGHDGTRGARDIFEARGTVVTQSAESCVVASMPSSVRAGGWSAATIPLDRIGYELVERVRRKSQARVSKTLNETVEP